MRRSGSPARSTAGYEKLPNSMASPVAELALISLSAITPIASSAVSPPSSSSTANQFASRAGASPQANSQSYASYPAMVTPSSSSASSGSSSVSPFGASLLHMHLPPSLPPAPTQPPSSFSLSPPATPDDAAHPQQATPSTARERERETQLAKRTNVRTTYVRASPSPSALSASPSSATRHRMVAEDDDDATDEEDGLLLTEDDLSIENYMRRHPCILDRGSSFLDRHPWVYQAIVVAFTGGGVACGSLVAWEMHFTLRQWLLAYTLVVLDGLLFLWACLRSPGCPPTCPDEASVIQLLHGWPASSHHYGLHASEWSRSWSYCAECRNWRPARAHHCRRCRTCVLMMDHHCVWVGQCVGANNLRHFAAYVTTTAVLALYGVGLAWKYVTWPFAAMSQSSSSDTLGVDLLADGAGGGGGSGVGSANLFLFLLLLLVSLCGLCASGWLVLRCAYIVLQNETAIEGLKKADWERERKRETLRQQQQLPTQTQVSITDKGKKVSSSLQTAAASSSSSSSSAASVVVVPPPLTKERMMRNEGGNGSVTAPPGKDHNSSAPTSPQHESSSPTSSRLSSRFFSPFQCACHADSFRVLYCSSFNYPALVSSVTPIPPLPFYHDYNTSDATMNWFLFWEDLRRMEKLHAWVRAGARPMPLAEGRHTRYPNDQKIVREVREQAEWAAKQELKQNAMYM